MKAVDKLKAIFKDWRVLILLFFLLAAAFSISPIPGRSGVAVRSVAKNSTAYQAGLHVEANVRPMGKERILSIDTIPIDEVGDFYDYVSTIESNRTVRLTTNVKTYQFDSITEGDLGIEVSDAPFTNLRKGLDLTGGIRAVLKPEKEINDSVFDLSVENLRERLNTYGLQDIVVKKITWPQKYILIEVADSTEEEVKELIGSQGKFEGKVANQTIIVGGKDITYVSFGGQSRVEDCVETKLETGDTGFSCKFTFGITLTQEAARKFADVTRDIPLDSENPDYISEPIYLYLDDVEVDSLRIAAGLRGAEERQIAISGPGFGTTYKQAYDEALKNMRRLQTIIKTGSLPVKFEFAEMNVISAPLGKDFTRNSIEIGLIAILVVAIVVGLRYRKWQIAVPMLIAMISEIILILGFAALVGWRLDLAAIAGVIIAIGTGVDALIVISDEVLSGEIGNMYNWKKRIKSAFFIITGAYLTTTFALAPLWFTGAGILRLFALTTFVGITFGLFVTRRAFAAIVEILLKE